MPDVICASRDTLLSIAIKESIEYLQKMLGDRHIINLDYLRIFNYYYHSWLPVYLNEDQLGDHHTVAGRQYHKDDSGTYDIRVFTGEEFFLYLDAIEEFGQRYLGHLENWIDNSPVTVGYINANITNIYTTDCHMRDLVRGEGYTARLLSTRSNRQGLP